MPKGKKLKIKFLIVESGAPYPMQVWVRQVGSNGRIFNHSELMSKRNAKRSIQSIISAIKENRYEIVERKIKK